MRFLMMSLTIISFNVAQASQTRMIYGETTKVEQLDPYTAHEATSLRLSDLIFDELISVSESGEYTPSLAATWKIEDAGSRVTLKLKENIFWHPSQGKPQKPFTAQDVATTIRILSASRDSLPNASRFDVFKKVETLGSHTLRISFQRALTDPLRYLLFKVLPDHVFQKETKLTKDHPFVSMPIGTGPYRLEKKNEQGELLLVAYEGYHQNRSSNISSIVMKPFADQTVMAQSLMFKSLDLVTYISPRDIKQIQGDKQLNLVAYDSLSYSFLAINNDKSILKDKRVRQAIAYSINRQELLDAFFAGAGNLISGPFPPSSWAYNLDVAGYEFDAEKAKSILESAGYGSEQLGYKSLPTLDFVVPIAGESDMLRRIALATQSYLANVGIPVELRFLEWGNWKNEVLGKHNYDLTLASWDFDDSSNITSLFHSQNAKAWGNNFVNYRNTDVDSLLSEAALTNDFDKKRAIYKSLHAKLADELPYVFLWNLEHHAAHQRRLSGVRVEPFSFFKYVKNWKINREIQ